MIRLVTEIKKFTKQGEKTGWTYVEIAAAAASVLKPGYKKSFRVKGKLDGVKIKALALLPMGEGNFILPLNATLRKALQKRGGDQVDIFLEVDDKPLDPPSDLMLCLKDEPEALHFFQSLAKGHQNYFGKWIDSAKTDVTRGKRIAHTVNAMLARKDYGAMIRAMKAEKDNS